MLGDVHAQKYSKTGTSTRLILEKFAFDTTLILIDSIYLKFSNRCLNKL